MESIFTGTPTRDGRKYFYRIQVNGRRITSQKYKTKEECINALSRFVLEEKNPYNKPFKLIAESYFKNLELTKKQSTIYTYIKDYNKHIKPYFEQKNINSINVQEIRKWAENLSKCGYSLEYLNKLYHLLKSIFDYGIKNYELKSNPVAIYGRFQAKNDKIISNEEKLRYITFDEFNEFIKYVDNDLWHCFFVSLFYTGCRKGELVALTWNDVNFEKKEISINKTLYDNIKGEAKSTSTKNNKNRIIKMSKTLYDELYSYKQKMIKYNDFSESWYVFGMSMHLANNTINHRKHIYFKKSNVREITIHEFRHSHVSLLINEYIKSGQTDTTKFFLMLSNRMGHTIDVMQRTYMHLFPTIQDEIVDLLDNL